MLPRIKSKMLLYLLCSTKTFVPQEIQLSFCFVEDRENSLNLRLSYHEHMTENY